MMKLSSRTSMRKNVCMVIRKLSDLSSALENLDRCYLQQGSHLLPHVPIILCLLALQEVLL